jgi:hypothetical protein
LSVVIWQMKLSLLLVFRSGRKLCSRSWVMVVLLLESVALI